MKKKTTSILFAAMFAVAFQAGAIPCPESCEETIVTGAAEVDFCTNLKKIIEGGKDGFAAVRGERTARKISGTDRPYDYSKVELTDAYKGYISLSESHPFYEVFFETETLPKITEKLKTKYEDIKSKMKECLPESEWEFDEHDAGNDIYLEGTEFKKLIVKEKKADAAGNRISMELFMYRHGTENKRVVELKIEGHAAVK